jgi:RimJ/RimL family protein N-acetyltransferase
MEITLSKYDNIDNQIIINAFNYPDLYEFTYESHYPFISDNANELKAISNKNPFHFGIFYKNVWVGFIEYNYNSTRMDSLGYTIGKYYWNKGIGTTAIKSLLDILKKNNIIKVYTHVFENNLPSIKILIKNGFNESEIYEKYIHRFNKIYRIKIYEKQILP